MTAKVGDIVPLMRRFILHDRWVFRLLLSSGWLVGFIYSISWLKTLSRFLMSGNIFPLLILASVYLALQPIWHNKRQLTESRSISNGQRYIGCALILIGMVFFGANLSHVWSQAVGWGITLVGLVMSQWGLSFFKIYRRSIILLLLSLYPGVNIVLEHLWTVLTPPKLLEGMTAWAANHILQIFGAPSRLEGGLIHLSTSGVEVSSGCNGLQMIFAILWIGLLMTHQQHSQKLGVLSLLGCGLAFVFNTIRVALLTIIAVYGDNSSFDFWHEAWGAQVFILPLFALYYFVSLRMGLIEPRPSRRKSRIKPA
jgi:exosortase